jgi:N-acetylglucosaminyldiphosphoundecaprenol N-acetyl-beta-D-mannosaminyltransferase
MSLNSQKILGVKVTTDKREIILEDIEEGLDIFDKSHHTAAAKRKKPRIVVTPNPEQIMYARTHAHFRDMLNRADVALPDGIGLVWAWRFLGFTTSDVTTGEKLERIPGVEFMEDLVQIAAKRGVRIGLIGGFDGLAVKALECLQSAYPGLSGWAEDGPILEGADEAVIDRLDGTFWASLAQKIVKTKTGIVFVGLGAPKQEYFIHRLTEELSVPVVCMSVGGSFAVFAGRLKRAPLFIRSIGFEWFWRLLQEPWRVHRQLQLFRFVLFVLRTKIVPTH